MSNTDLKIQQLEIMTATTYGTNTNLIKTYQLQKLYLKAYQEELTNE